MSERENGSLTRVDLLFLKERIERWIRFGRPIAEQVQDRRRRTVMFAPGAVFAFVRWRAGEFGTVDSRIAVLRAVGPASPFTTYPEVSPGAEILLDVAGWTKVQAVFEAIDGVERTGVRPEFAAPDYWRHVGARVGVDLPPRPYSRRRHRAWLLRRSFLS
ncbi:glycosidase [Caulobacter sp. Root656]|nr:glycosidase [Caulobacter sp. Root656]